MKQAGACVAAGSLGLLLAWLPALQHLMPGPFSGHMLSHMLLVAVAAPLLAAGVTALPALPLRRLALALSPVPVAVLEFLLVWGWHAPGLHALARADARLWVLEQASFLLAGLALWVGALARGPDGRFVRSIEGAFALLLTATHMTLLGVLLALSPRALFHDSDGHHDGTLPALVDQEIGGVLMLAVGGIAYLVGALALLRATLSEPAARHWRRSLPRRETGP